MKKIFLTLIIFSGLTIVSCKKFLDSKPSDFLQESSYYNNLEQITSALAAVYDPLFQNSIYGKDYQAVITIQTDDIFNRNDPTGGYNLVNNSHDYTNTVISAFWNSCYNGIQKANVLLENIYRAQVSNPAAKNSVKGEALFLRAYYYFLLVQHFGDVPLKLSSTRDATDINIPRSSIKEVYGQITKDMIEAEALVYPNYAAFSNSSSRVTRTVVQGILARVYLYMAGYPLRDESKYIEALKWATKVKESGIHELNIAYEKNPANLRGGSGDFLNYNLSNGNPGYVNNPYSQVFLNESRAQYFIKESMWESDNFVDGILFEGGFIGSQYSGPQTGSNYSILGRVSNQVLTTQLLYVSYVGGDLRRDWNLMTYQYTTATEPQKSFLATTTLTSGSKNGRPLGKWRREYEPMNGTKSGWNTNIKFPLLRYADVLLMYAEAEYHVNGATSNAIDAVNEIRRRAFGFVNNTSPIKLIKISNGGNNYGTVPQITISGDGAAAATCTISNKKVNAITLTNPGIGYVAPPTVTFSGNGSGAAATVELYSATDIDLPKGMPGGPFLDSLKMERYREFPGEALRKSDLIRWGEYYPALTKLSNYFTGVGGGQTLSSNTIKLFTMVNNTVNAGNKFLLFPIPASEILSNKVMKQNPGW